MAWTWLEGSKLEPGGSDEGRRRPSPICALLPMLPHTPEAELTLEQHRGANQSPSDGTVAGLTSHLTMSSVKRTPTSDTFL